jgi:hypothetical protein
MDEKRFFNLLKNLQSVMKCPSCGSFYEVSEMQFVGSQDGYFLLSLNCSKCSLPVWVNIFSGKSNNRGFVGDLTINDITLLERDPINTEEVIKFHLSIKKFDGDFKKAFSR